MDTMHQVALVVVALILVLLNGFFVASEFSIVKVRVTRIQELAQKGSARAVRAAKVIGKLDEYLSATQLGITLTSLGLGWIGEPAFAELFAPLFVNFGGLQPVLSHSLAATVAFLTITFLHIVLGELAPKSIAIQRPVPVVLWTSPPLALFYRISYPFIWALNGTATLFLKALGLPPVSESELVHSEEELRLILAQSNERGVLGRDERRMLERVFDFGDRTVRQVMVPSTDVIFLDVRTSSVENIQIAREHQHTRYPLCDRNLDRVLGIVHVKDLFAQQDLGPDFDLSTVKRPAQFVPDSAPISSLLTDLRRTRSHLAIVVDEYGSTVGIATLDNVLEELVGDIRDEFDVESDATTSPVQKLEPGRYLVHGRVLLEELDYELGIELDDDENDTIGGHVMMRLGRTAVVGDEVTIGDEYRARVTGMKGFQITGLLIEKIQKPKESEK